MQIVESILPVSYICFEVILQFQILNKKIAWITFGMMSIYESNNLTALINIA